MKFEEASPITLREGAAEFTGTFLLVFTVGCNVLAGSASWGALSIAAVLAVLVYIFAPISGAHLNPAVSVSLGLSGKCSWQKVGAYVVMQFLGGAIAGLGFLVMFGTGIELEPTAGHVLWQAGLSEILYTFFLCFTVLNVAASKMHGGSNQYFGLAIGGVIVAGAYSGGSISKGCFNPAVAVGINISAGGILYSLTYTAFEIVGAAAAAGLFKVCRPEDFDSTEAKDVVYPLEVKLVAEFIGTFFLMLTAGLDVASRAKAAAVSIAASLTVMIFSLGSVSGGHFNPAVTLAVFAAGRKDAPSVKDALAYVGTQVAAALAAGLIFLAMTGGSFFPLAPGIEFSFLQAMVCEVVFTFVLAFVVLSVTAKAESPMEQFAPLAIGLCVVCGGLACGTVSGGVLNPAVAAGVAFAHSIMGGGTLGFLALLPYALAELAGGALAAAAFRFGRPQDYEEKLLHQAEAQYGSP